MSDGGGDTGGADKGGGGGGDTNSPSAENGWVYQGPPAASQNMSTGAQDTSGSALGLTSPGDQAGFHGSGLPSEIISGSSTNSASQWSSPSINDFVSGPDGGFNLAGPGPVSGDSGTQPFVHGGVFSSDSSNSIPVSQDSNSIGTTAPSSGGGTSALALAAPTGVSGTQDLSSLVSAPNASTSSISPSDQNIFDSLKGAEAATVNDYVNQNPANIPSTPSGTTTLPSTTAASSGSSSDGGSSNGGLIPGVSNNTLGIGAAGIGLANNLINGNKPLANATLAGGVANNTNAVAQQQNESGVALQQYITTGKLPQGYEDQVQQAAQAAKQQIISNYAGRGLPTDPNMNSQLAQELNQVDARLPAMREQIAGQLASTGGGMVSAGLQAAGISSGVYQKLADIENDQNKQRGQAISNFAAALNGGNKGVTLNLGKAA